MNVSVRFEWRHTEAIPLKSIFKRFESVRREFTITYNLIELLQTNTYDLISFLLREVRNKRVYGRVPNDYHHL